MEYTVDKHAPYNTLKKELKARRVRYDDIAELLDLSTPAVCKKMNGESDFFLYEMRAMCRAYELPVDAFCG